MTFQDRLEAFVQRWVMGPPKGGIMIDPEFDDCGVETQDSWARRRISKRLELFEDVRAVLNTISSYHQRCTCPDRRTAEAIGDDSMCENCLCADGHKSLDELEKI